MKVYELISELMEYPAGYNVTFGVHVDKKDFPRGQETIDRGAAVEEIEVSETYKEIELRGRI